VSCVDAACWPVQSAHNSVSLKHFLVLVSKFMFDAFNTGVVQLRALLCSEHGASHFELFFSVSIRYVVKKFTTYCTVHFTNWLADFGASCTFCVFLTLQETQHFGGGEGAWR
jgi:hypothetical protein